MPWPWQRQAAAVDAAQPPGTPSEVALGEAVDLQRVSHNMAKEYVRSIYLWRCVDMIGSMAASVPLIVAKEEEETQLTAAELAVERLLHYPNPQWSGAALQYYVAASIAVVNKAFLLRVRGAGDVVLELWPLDPSSVTVNYRENERMIESFTVLNGMKQQTYRVDGRTGDSDVIYIRRPALNMTVDKSPAAIAAAPAEVFTRVLQRCADIVSNTSNITGLLSTDAEIGPKGLAEIKDKLAQFKTGRASSGGTVIAGNAKWSLTRLSEDPAQALSVQIKDSLARDVVMTFGVPTQLCGLPGTDTYNNIALARVGFLTDTVLPGYVNFYVAGLNHALMRNGARIRPDTEHIPAMLAARWELTRTANEATMLSINEQRMMLGYPPFEHDDADIPVKLLELLIKRLAIEAQGGVAGGVGGILAAAPT